MLELFVAYERCSLNWLMLCCNTYDTGLFAICEHDVYELLNTCSMNTVCLLCARLS